MRKIRILCSTPAKALAFWRGFRCLHLATFWKYLAGKQYYIFCPQFLLNTFSQLWNSLWLSGGPQGCPCQGLWGHRWQAWVSWILFNLLLLKSLCSLSILCLLYVILKKNCLKKKIDTFWRKNYKEYNIILNRLSVVFFFLRQVYWGIICM